jgi:2-amino-4-hydroxy-6-hydroxymethyldihydropteridine diphosphokinase
METIYIGLGSNQDNPDRQLEEARHRIAGQIGAVVAESQIYRTQAWGKTDQPDFLNQVIEVHTRLSPREVLDHLLRIEQQMGRVRNEKWSPRPIDLDLLFFGTRVVKEPGLKVPHPFLHVRNFVLYPLCELAPHFMHPELQLSIEQLKSESPDTLLIQPV